MIAADLPPLVRRQMATKATLAHVHGRKFALGRLDCARMAAFHLKQLGWRVRLSKIGNYKTALGARAALRRLGCETVMEAVDSLGLPRIAPARALPGDLVSFACGHELGALGVVVGNGNMLAFHESHELPVIMAMTGVDLAWDALPAGRAA